MSTITVPGIYDGLTNAEYHRDPIPEGSLSVSGAKKLLAPSTPAAFKYSLDHPQEHKRAFDYGTAAHSIVLEGDESGLVILDYKDYRTKDAQEQQAKAYEENKTPLLTKEVEQVREMADAIRRHPIAGRLFGSGKPEQSAFWQDPETGVWRRARFDWLPEISSSRRLIIPDYKTSVSADPYKFAKTCWDYRYHMQDPWYRDAITQMNLHDDVAFVFVVQEKTAPYTVNVIELDITAVRTGRDLNRRALTTYANCAANNHWPDYTGITQISLPIGAEYEAERILDNAA
jgi:PDDEXK-like domain of unknown function (DUF3799)